MKVLLLSKAMTLAAYHAKARGIARAPGIQLTVAVPERYGRAHLEIASGDGYRLRALPVVLGGHNHFHLYRGLGRVVREEAPDVFHIDEDPWSAVTEQALDAASGTRARPLFFTWQNLMKRYPWPWSAIERRTFARAPWAIAGNAEAADVLRRRGYAGEVRTIPQFGVDPEIFRPRPGDPAVRALRERLGLPERGVVGYVGRLVPEKGVLDLLEGFLAVAPPGAPSREGPSGPPVLLYIGHGPLRGEIGRRARARGLAGRVRVLEAVPSARVPLHMNLLDLLVLPSRTTPRWKEQFGRVLVEAMASGVPVAGSDSGEIPRVIGDLGTVVPEGSAPALAEVIVRRLREIEAGGAGGGSAGGADHGSKARAGALARFSNERVVEETVRYYRDIAGAAGRAER